MTYSGLSRGGLAMHTLIPRLRLRRLGSLAVLMTALVAVAPAAARPAGHNGQIAFVRADPLVGHSVYTVNPDGSHEQQLLSDPVDLNGPHWSRDGGAIVAFAAGDGSAAWIVDADTGTHRAIPNPDPGKFNFFFACSVPSPDFERLACGGGGEDPSSNGLYTVRASDGGDLRQLTSNTIEDDLGDYSPDGKRLVYFHFNGWDDTGLEVLKVNGTGTRKIAPCCASGGSWSPQGNEIVFSSGPPATSFEDAFHSTLWLVHSDGSGLHQIPIPESVCGGAFADPDARGCVDPVWSPDGKKILFRLTGTGFGEGGDLYTINADGTDMTQVTHDGDVDVADWGTHPLATG
jgi:Tol biopolymer transport system component